MTRFFISGRRLEGGGAFTIEGDDAHHLINVLRARPGDEVTAVGPDGTEYVGSITSISEAGVTVAIKTSRLPAREPAVNITLVQGLLKGDGFDLVLRKGTEAGVSRFIPLVSARTVVKIPPDRLPRRRRRWQKIAEAAARQSGRLVVPRVDEPVSVEGLEQAAGFPVPGGLLLAWEGETGVGLYDVLEGIVGEDRHRGEAPQRPGPPSDLWLIIGPEGGFQRREAERLIEAGAQAVSLGPLIFRADFAGPAMTIMTLYHLGHLGRGRHGTVSAEGGTPGPFSPR